MASRHLIQEADIADGRAGHPCSWVLQSCCGSQLCSKNRAPQSVDHSPRHSHIPTLGDDDSTMPDWQHAKDNVIIIFTFACTSQFIHFLSIFTLIAFASIVIDARVCVQSHIYRIPNIWMYIRCLLTCWMESCFLSCSFLSFCKHSPQQPESPQDNIT